MRAYDARKKLEMIGAMTFNSAGEIKHKHVSERGDLINPSHHRFTQLLPIKNNYICRDPTNENEGQANAKGEKISSQGLVVLAVALPENGNPRVDIVFA